MLEKYKCVGWLPLRLTACGRAAERALFTPTVLTQVLESFLILVQPSYPLHQLPLLTAALVVDEVASQDLLQLPHSQAFNILQMGQVRQRGPPAWDETVL